MPVAILAALALAAPVSGVQAIPVSLPVAPKVPAIREGASKSEDSAPAPRKRFFGLGVAFQNRGGAQGIALEQVVPGSPADLAGFAVGTIIVEIEGQSTLGRSGEDCTRMVRDAANAVSLKYYDPLTFKLRTRIVQKEWFPLPN